VRTSPTLLLIWLLATIGHIAVCWQLIRCRMVGRWPSVFAYCAVSAAGSLLLYSQMSVYARYFWIFWVREAILEIIRICVVVDIVRSIPSGRFIPRPFTIATTLISGSIGYIAWSANACHWSLSHMLKAHQWLDFVLKLNQCVTASWAGALIGLLCGVALSGFGLYRQAVRIASGYIAMIVSGMMAAAIYASSHALPALNSVAENVTGVVEIATLAYWFFSLQTQDDAETMTADQDRELSEHLTELSRLDPRFNRSLEKDGTA